jgi:hypothetical protein
VQAGAGERISGKKKEERSGEGCRKQPNEGQIKGRKVRLGRSGVFAGFFR